MVGKRGISTMIGYVLLISAMVIMWFIVFQWLKTYVPGDTPECPDDVSLIIEDVGCSSETGLLTLEKIKNNGLFSIDGFVLRAEVYITTEEGVRVKEGTKDLTDGYFYFINNQGNKFSLYPGEENAEELEFGGEGEFRTVDFIEITPLRLNEENGKTTPILCEKAVARKDITDLGCVIKIKD